MPKNPCIKTSKNPIDVPEEQRKHVRAFITAFNSPSTINELISEYLLVGAYLDIELLLFSKFRENRYIEWTVPKWAKPGDICMFYFAKTANEELRQVQKEFELKREYFDLSIELGLDTLLRRGWQYYETYAGTILAVGRVASIPYYLTELDESSHYKSRLSAEIKDIVLLRNPLPISEFRDVVFITRGGTITPVLGREFDVVRSRIAEDNELPDYFLNCSTKPIPLREINSNNWMTVAHEYRAGFMLEQEFRACYVDYLLQSISDNGIVYRECRTRKTIKGRFKKGFVDNAILFNGKYLPVEVKLNVEAEAHLESQCESYCHLNNLFLTEEKSVSRKTVYGGNVLIVDTVGLYLYSSQTRAIKTIVNLDDISQETKNSIRKQIAQAINQNG